MIVEGSENSGPFLMCFLRFFRDGLLPCRRSFKTAKIQRPFPPLRRCFITAKNGTNLGPIRNRNSSPFSLRLLNHPLTYLSLPSSKSTKTTKNTETLSDFRAVSWRCHPDSNWGIKVLQWAKALLSFARKSLFYGLFCDFCCCRNH